MDIKIINEKEKFKVRVSGIFIFDNRILVNKYDEDSYCLPGGTVEIGETSEEAILRELKEEINLDFEIASFMGITENFFTNLRKQKTHSIDFYYKVNLINNSDCNKIDYNRIENDKGVMVQHHFKWINMSDLQKSNLLPSVIKEKIIKDSKLFHIVVKGND